MDGDTARYPCKKCGRPTYDPAGHCAPKAEAVGQSIGGALAQGLLSALRNTGVELDRLRAEQDEALHALADRWDRRGERTADHTYFACAEDLRAILPQRGDT